MKFKVIIGLALLAIVLLAVVWLLFPVASIGRAKLIAKPMAAKADLQALSVMLDTYKTENGFYPTTQQGLDALVHKPETSPIPQRWTKHLPDIPKDPWGHFYRYRFLTPTGPNPYALFSLGSDGVESRDDLF